MQQSYDKNETDEFVQPTVVLHDGKPVACMKANDSIVFYNFRKGHEAFGFYSFSDIYNYLSVRNKVSCLRGNLAHKNGGYGNHY